jgi:hypothetical protein
MIIEEITMFFANSILTKSIVSMFIISFALSVVVGFVNVEAPYAKNFQVHLDSWNSNVLSFTGSADIYYKNPQAWSNLGYKGSINNFPSFDTYWHNQIGKTFSYAGVNVKLVDISITPTYHASQGYDHLQFTIKLQQV